MEELLSSVEHEHSFGKLESYSTDHVAEALSRFVEALKQALPTLQPGPAEEVQVDSRIDTTRIVCRAALAFLEFPDRDLVVLVAVAA